MVAAGLATGNAVVLKPAEQAPGCALRAGARRCARPACRRARSRCCRARATSAPRWSRDPRVHTIAFTGSRRGRPGDRPRRRRDRAAASSHLKRVIAEMGGKNCVIVDADADLDEVVPALVQSAFAYAGPEVLGRLARARATRRSTTRSSSASPGAVEVLAVGPGRAARHRRPARDRARGAGARRALRRRGRARRAGSPRGAADVPGGGLVRRARASPPTCRPTPPVLHEEIFGPLLAVERVRDVDEACDRVDASPFALTGGLFARNPRHGRLRRRPLAGRQPLRQPRDHRRDGRAASRSAATGSPAPGRRPAARLPAAVRRAARGDREHHAPRPRGLEMDATELEGIHHITAITGDAPAQRRVLRRRARPADGQEDRQPGRPDRLPPLLRRRAGLARRRPDVLRVPRRRARARRATGWSTASSGASARRGARLLGRAAGRRGRRRPSASATSALRATPRASSTSCVVYDGARRAADRRAPRHPAPSTRCRASTASAPTRSTRPQRGAAARDARLRRSAATALGGRAATSAAACYVYDAAPPSAAARRAPARVHHIAFATRTRGAGGLARARRPAGAPARRR